MTDAAAPEWFSAAELAAQSLPCMPGTKRGVAKLAAASMRARGGGKIINVASIAGRRPQPGMGVYCVSKAAVLMLTEVLAVELADDNVQVNAIAPGAVEGDRMERVLANESAASGKPIEELRQTYVKGVSLKTWVSADDLADMALFLASPAASKISGQIMAVDGHTESLVP